MDKLTKEKALEYLSEKIIAGRNDKLMGSFPGGWKQIGYISDMIEETCRKDAVGRVSKNDREAFDNAVEELTKAGKLGPVIAGCLTTR